MDKPEFLVELGPVATDEAFAIGMAKLLEREGRTIAAAELRRLHQFAEDQIGRATAAEAALQMTKATHALKIAAVETQRDALLEAYRKMKNVAAGYSNLCDGSAFTRKLEREFEAADAIARAAIKTVEEGK